MAKEKNGKLSGLVGTVVVYTWKGKPVMRSRPSTKSKRVLRAKRSKEQAQQISRFAFASRIVRNFRALFEHSFETNEGELSRGQAMRYLLRGNAITGKSPDFKLDYSQLQVSKGPVKPAEGASAKLNQAGNIIFTWKNNEEEAGASPYDQAVLIAFSEEVSSAVPIYTMEGGGREKEKGTLSLPSYFHGKKLHTWIAFSRSEGVLSDSVYCGLL